MRFEFVHLALIGGAHGAARAVGDRAHVHAGLLAELHELAETRFKDALHAARVGARIHRALVQIIQIGATPELFFKFVSKRGRTAQRKIFEKDVVPRKQRGQQQDHHHALHQHAGAGDQAQYRHVVRYAWSAGSHVVLIL